MINRMTREDAQAMGKEAAMILLDAKAAFDRAMFGFVSLVLFKLGSNVKIIQSLAKALESTRTTPCSARGPGKKSFELKHGLGQGTMLAVIGWIATCDLILNAIRKFDEGRSFENNKNEHAASCLIPMLMDDSKKNKKVF